MRLEERVRQRGMTMAIGLMALRAGCSRGTSPPEGRRETEAAIAGSVEAIRVHNIDAFVATIPQDLVARGEDVKTIVREARHATGG
jgi:hypothetical protein